MPIALMNNAGTPKFLTKMSVYVDNLKIYHMKFTIGVFEKIILRI